MSFDSETQFELARSSVKPVNKRKQSFAHTSSSRRKYNDKRGTDRRVELGRRAKDEFKAGFDEKFSEPSDVDEILAKIKETQTQKAVPAVVSTRSIGFAAATIYPRIHFFNRIPFITPFILFSLFFPSSFDLFS